MNIEISRIYKVIAGVENVYGSPVLHVKDNIPCVTFTSFRIRNGNTFLSDTHTCDWFESHKIAVFHGFSSIIFAKINEEGEVTELSNEDAELERLFIACPTVYDDHTQSISLEFQSSMPADSRCTTPDIIRREAVTPPPPRKRRLFE